MERQIANRVTDGGYDGTAADIWSVGIVLFVLLSGTQPTNSKMEHKWSACNFDDDSIWRIISWDAKDLIQQMTLVDALRRPSASSTLLTSWFSNSISVIPSQQQQQQQQQQHQQQQQQ